MTDLDPCLEAGEESNPRSMSGARLTRDQRAQAETRRRYDTYLELRAAALAASPSEISAQLEPPNAEPYGILMEIGLRQGIATLACFASGRADLYTSAGGGLSSGRSNEVIQEASQRFVKVGRNFVVEGENPGSFLLPRYGEVKFYLLGRQGAWKLDASLNELNGRRSALCPLYDAGRRVLNELLSLSDPEYRPE